MVFEFRKTTEGLEYLNITADNFIRAYHTKNDIVIFLLFGNNYEKVRITFNEEWDSKILKENYKRLSELLLSLKDNPKNNSNIL